MLTAVILILGVLPQDKDEGKLRAAFAKEFKAKEAAKRIEAAKKLEGCKEEKTLEALAVGLKDLEKDVKIAVANAIATCTDEGGAAIKPVGAALVNKQENPDVRYACARALAKAHYKTEAVDLLLETINGISNKDRDLFEFGKNVTVVLEGFTGEKFGYEKVTPQLWDNWWKETKAKYQKDDEEKRKKYKETKK